MPAALIAASLMLPECSGTIEVDVAGAKSQAEMQFLEARIVHLIGDARCSEVHEAWNHSTGTSSTCDFAGQPRITSVDGRCVAVRN